MLTKQGVVVKKSGDKTVRVEVTSSQMHPKYKKSFTRTKGFLVHDEENSAQVGDQVTIAQSRKVSKRKSFALVKP